MRLVDDSCDGLRREASIDFKIVWPVWHCIAYDVFQLLICQPRIIDKFSRCEHSGATDSASGKTITQPQAFNGRGRWAAHRGYPKVEECGQLLLRNGSVETLSRRYIGTAS